MTYISSSLTDDKEEVIVWLRNEDGKRVKKRFNAPYYFYAEDDDGEHKDLFGRTLTRFDFTKARDFFSARKELLEKSVPLFEADIAPDYKVLSENFYNKRVGSLNITFFDIEVDYDPDIGFSSPQNPYAPINSVAIYHTHTNRTIVLAVPPKGRKNIKYEDLPQDIKDGGEIILCEDEEELLIKFFEEIDDSDIISGWNCIPENQSVWTDSKIIPIKDVTKSLNLYDSKVNIVFPKSNKKLAKIKIKNGITVESSYDHKFIVKTCDPDKYTNMLNSTTTTEELSAQEIYDYLLSNKCVFAEYKLRKNENPPHGDYSNEQLYLAGLIYTDGTLKKKNTYREGFTIFQSDLEMIKNLPLLESSVVGPYKENYSRHVSCKILGEAANLIYKDGNKHLNLESLSRLSYTQFMNFLSGLLDGDGYLKKGAIYLCNFNDDLEILNELLLWNGLFSTVKNNSLRMVNLEIHELFLKKHSRWKNKYIREEFLPRSSKRKANDFYYRIIEDVCYVKIDAVELTDDIVPMIDINTSTSRFVSKGMLTHNCDFFDVPYVYERANRVIHKKAGKKLCFDNLEPHYREVEMYGNINKKLILQGRISLDYLDVYKKFEMSEKPSYKLEHISEEELPDLPKLEYDGSLHQLYNNDFEHFIRYNLRDTEILKGLEEKKKYMKLAVQMSHMATTKVEDVLGTIKVAEMSIINYCHYVKGVRVPNSKNHEKPDHKYSGATVFDPQVGMHEWVASIDLASLYPSTMRALNISPETIVGQFIDGERAFEALKDDLDIKLTYIAEDSGKVVKSSALKFKRFLKNNNWSVSASGTVFTQEQDGVIPSILNEWFNERKVYKKKMFEASSDSDEALREYYDRMQYIKKIQLNSMYGACGNMYFKFYDVRLAESTTLSGRQILFHMAGKAAEVLSGNYNIEDDSIVYGDSVAENTKIYISPTEEVEIRDLFLQLDDKIDTKEYFYPENLKVLTYCEKSNATLFKPVKYVMRHKVNKKVYRVYLNNTQYIDVTEDHSLIGYKNTIKKLKGESHLIEVKPTDLNKTIKSIVYQKNLPREEILSKNYNKKLYEILGLIVGDGYAGNKKENGNHAGVGLSVGHKDIPDIEQKVLYPLKSEKIITSWHIRKNTHDVRICGTAFFDIVKESLYDSLGNKRIPDWLVYETEENICNFLRGYFSADGSVLNGNVILSSISANNLRKVQQLLFYCGISSSIFKENTENSYNGVYSKTHSYKLHVSQKDKFKEKIGFIFERKNEKIKISGKSLKYNEQFDFYIKKIHKVEELEYTGYVYDIEVEDTHTFFANNILVHNTDSVYFKTYKENKDDALYLANHICDEVNKSYPDFMKSAFFCDDERSKLMKAEQEIVSDRGIFIKKKYYILHLVSDDGKEVDKMKNMGVPIKKTTLPKEIKNKLSGFIERLLTGEDWDTIGREIVDFRDTLKTIDDVLMIGLPKGIKGLETYTEKFNNKEPDLRLPGHVSASILWNSCLKSYKDNESPRINSGSKINVFYLKNKIGNFKSIAVPKDISTLPDWFTEHFVPIIDRDAQIERLVDKPMEIMISAAGIKVPTKKKLMFEEGLFE